MRRGNTVLMGWPLTKHCITAGIYYNDGTYHGAIDLRANLGTPVYAAEDGTVEFLYRWNGKRTKGDVNSYGNMLRIKHEDYTNIKGNKVPLVTIYAHLSKFAVSRGDKVKEGDLIGFTGNTGNCYGPHLHFEVRLNNRKQQPLYWLDNDFTTANTAVTNHLGTYKSVER